MAQGTTHTRHWRIGALAAIAVIAGATLASANGGLSFTAGGVQMTMDVTAESGLDIRFMRAVPENHAPAVPQLAGHGHKG